MVMPQYKSGKLVGVLAEICANGERIMRKLDECQRFAERLCEHIGMTKMVSVPFEVWDEEESQDGVSCVVGMKESHIAIHTWPHDRAVRVTVDSCKEFNISDVLMFVRDEFSPSVIKHGVVEYF